MPESPVIALIKRLTLRTNEGKLKWEETAEEGMFQTAFPEYVVQVKERLDPSSGDPSLSDYIVRVRDRDGSLVEEVADPDLKHDWPPAYLTMRDLYIGARRSAKGVDKAIHNILSALGEEDDIPF